MRSSITVAAAVLLVAYTALAASTVKLPNGFVVPEHVVLTGETLYHSIANSLNTLPRNADPSRVAAVSGGSSTLLGDSGMRRASIVVVPAVLAPEESVNGCGDNAFPLEEMSLTLSTALVMPGASYELQDAFASRSYTKVNAPIGMKMPVVSNALLTCGVHVSQIEGDAFILNNAQFNAKEVRDILAAAAAVCSNDIKEQVTVVDFRPTYDYTVKTYGENSDQARAVAEMINSVSRFLTSETFEFVLATDAAFYERQKFVPEQFVAVPPRLSARVANPTNTTEITTSKNAGAFQILLWFIILMVVVICVFVLLTCGVGIDIEKDTLLYQTTCLRGQPVF